jgi:4-diphosphocytidyl-2-C-methyl-D-erythritol kinase
MRILSPAKINLHLRIGPLASGKFHPLLSWMCTVGLHDTLKIEPAREPDIRLKCDRSDVPTDETNLIIRAGRALNDKLGAHVRLQKKIPIGGGLGGGSSNAAFALIGFNQIWNLKFPIDRLAKIGATLGSDVPFFLHGPSSICAGRGEQVKPIPKPAPKFAILIFPHLSMSTPAVYRRFDEMNLGSTAAISDQPDWNEWTKLPAVELLKNLVNDLEAPAFSLCPELGKLREKIEQKIGRTVRMSGSGSTLFTLADTQQDADAISHQLTPSEWGTVIVASIAPDK